MSEWIKIILIHSYISIIHQTEIKCSKQSQINDDKNPLKS